MNHDIPEPTHTVRDTDGRLVRITINQRFSETGNTAWLIAGDGSAHAEQAMEKSLALLHITHTQTLIHIVNVQSWMSKEAAEHELLTKSWQATQGIRHLLAKHTVNWCLHVVMDDDIGSALLTIAQELNCDGLIMGSKGLGETEALLLGSVANWVVHHSPLPVLVIR